MEKKVTWKDRCDMQMTALVKASMNTFGCTEEQAYEAVFKALCSTATEAVFKALCSTATYKLLNELLGKDDG